MSVSAVDVYGTDLLDAASALVEQDLAALTNDPQTLCLRALLLARENGALDAAIACATRAVDADAQSVTCHVVLGDLLIRAGRHTESLSLYLSALTRSAGDKALYVRLAHLLQALGRLREAEALFRWALELEPTCSSTHGELGELLCTRGRLQDAIDSCLAAVRLAPNDVDAYLRLGRIHLTRQEWSLALASFERGLDLRPDTPDLRVGAGDALMGQGRLVEARTSFKAALAEQPMHLNAARRLVRVAEQLRDRSDTASAWCRLGASLQSHRQYDESAWAYARAVALVPDSVPALVGLAGANIATGRPDRSIAPLEASLARVSYDTAIHMDLGTAHHLLGDRPRGWDALNKTYDDRTLKKRGRGLPQWDGSPLRGRTLLLWTDMGRGDVIQFLRYIEPVARDGGRIVVQCHHARLVPLIERIAGVTRVIAPGGPLPHVDVHAPLNFLPAFVSSYRAHLSGTVPYLSADPNLIVCFQERLGSKRARLIGLSWAGNAETLSAPGRFVTLAHFASLRHVQGTQFVSLQHGPQAEELLACPRGFRVERVLGASNSIDDAAALLSCLDLVITVDTMIAHLAGALGRPVWTLLRYATNWRWGLSGEQTEWYPTMRLFRQTKPGDWNAVFARVRDALEAEKGQFVSW